MDKVERLQHTVYEHGDCAFDVRLEELGWSQGYLAKRLGVHRNTVSGWVTGKLPVPQYANEYLRVMWLAREILAEDWRTDG